MHKELYDLVTYDENLFQRFRRLLPDNEIYTDAEICIDPVYMIRDLHIGELLNTEIAVPHPPFSFIPHTKSAVHYYFENGLCMIAFSA
ncbi:hypothetical protein HYZ97_01510 [Candidatus Pacearchaeota archaeon]|nr:hypothetical protein [Candidatus Pacearchaeota archaeon]